MFVILGLIAGALTGAFVARRRKGATADVLHYAAVYAMLFALAGLLVTILVHRAAV